MLSGVVQGELNEERNVVEVKISPEHDAKIDGDSLTHVDAITSETGDKMDSSGKPKIEVTKNSGSS